MARLRKDGGPSAFLWRRWIILLVSKTVIHVWTFDSRTHSDVIESRAGARPPFGEISAGPVRDEDVEGRDCLADRQGARASVKFDIARYLPAILPFALFCVMAAIYLGGHLELYFSVIRHYGVRPYVFPFGDTDGTVSALDCYRRGVDVIAANPCDSLRRPYNYSPIWLWFAVLPVTREWLQEWGLVTVGLFLASLLLLPRQRDWNAILIMSAATISTAVFFAVERGNNDLNLFALAALGATLLTYSYRVRLVGYALLLLAGLLKYYPLAMMLIAVRERPRRFVFLALASIAITVVLALLNWGDLSRVLGLIPNGNPLDDFFGSASVGLAIMDELNLSRTGAKWIQIPMCVAGIWAGVRLGLAERTRVALSLLTERESMFLMIGSLLMIGCFFAAQNVGYRVLHLLFVLPALLALRGFAPAWRFRYAPYLVLVVLWHKLLRINALAWGWEFGGRFGHDAMQYLACLIREICLWTLIAVLLGYVVAYVQNSCMWREMMDWARMRSGPLTA